MFTSKALWRVTRNERSANLAVGPMSATVTLPRCSYNEGDQITVCKRLGAKFAST